MLFSLWILFACLDISCCFLALLKKDGDLVVRALGFRVNSRILCARPPGCLIKLPLVARSPKALNPILYRALNPNCV